MRATMRAMAETELAALPVLFVDDEKENLDIVRFNFKKQLPLHLASSGAEALELLAKEDVAVIVSDQRMPGMDGLTFLAEARKVRPDAVGLLLTAFADVPVLVQALNSGLVYRYLQKPWTAADLGQAIRQAQERFHLVRENRRLNEKLSQVNRYLAAEAEAPFNFGEIVGEADSLKGVLELVERVAPTTSTVLLRGESGTGKELLARAIHLASPRAKKAFVRVNCAALAPGVLESELFGHEKGAFTGALAKRLGRFELADEGTIFLDEIGELAPEIQVKLLRVLQERELERVGGIETLKVDVRVISATNRNLEKAIEDGAFREDLYYRLNVFPLHVPPLRDRPGDVPRLAEHFVRKLARTTGKAIPGLTPAALAKLAAYPWPGNVRELENVIERAMILARGAQLDEVDLDFGPRKAPAASLALGAGPLPAQLEELERQRLLEALEKHGGRKADVARELGINRSTLYYRLKKFGLDDAGDTA